MKHKTIIFLLIFGLFLIGCSNTNSDKAQKINFPTHVYLEKLSPDKKTKAIIYSWSNEASNLLGSNDRFILGFTNPKAKWYIDFELSEGFGTYEGGISGIEWLNANEVVIKRRISDSPKDIKYNLNLNEWLLINKD